MWKIISEIEGFEEFEGYRVSDSGVVESFKTGKWVPIKGCGGEYKQVGLCKNGKRKIFRIHRLVVEAFNRKIEDGLVVNHIDNDGHNNNISNLEIVTQGQNNRMAVNESSAPKGLKAFREEICEMYKNGKSPEQISEKYGCRARSIWYQLKKTGITKKDIYEPDKYHKISDKDAENIRKSSKRGVDLAREYGVVPSYIWNIRNNKNKNKIKKY